MDDNIQIKDIPPRIQYIADGTKTEFEFLFTIFKEKNLKVFFDNVVQKETTYNILIHPLNKGGVVTFFLPPKNGTVVTLFRELAIERTSCFQEGGALRAAVVNHEFDFQIACQQQIADTFNRTMVLPPYAVNTDVNLTLPTPKAGKAIVWNIDGTNLENSEVEINKISRELDEKVSTATGKADICVEKADICVKKANICVEKSDIAVQKANEAVNTVDGKANSNFSNINPNIDFITETWRSTDGTSWYKKYKSGWVEQGGIIRSGSRNLPVPMLDEKYVLLVSLNESFSPNAGTQGLVIFVKTVSMFNVQFRWNGGAYDINSISYYVTGQGAQS